MIAEIIEPLPMEPGEPQRYDYQYERNSMCNLFMFFEPLNAWLHVEFTEGVLKIDYAQQIQYLVDVRYPETTKITVVHDQLNTHIPAYFYKAFTPAKAKDILNKLEFYYTPKHGSW